MKFLNFNNFLRKNNINTTRLQEVACDWSKSDYYTKAEESTWLLPFWNEKSIFLNLFRQLDLNILVELACGQGRHTAQIITGQFNSIPKKIFLLDYESKNIKFCAQRFATFPFINAIQNNGFNLQPLKSDSITAIFCYDAMVHFEYDCIISYLKDTYRVLQPQGRALFHHSNYTKNPGAIYRDNPHWRNFMSKELFSHIAERNGLRVLNQIVLDWGEENRVSAIDTLTLLEKPSVSIRNR